MVQTTLTNKNLTYSLKPRKSKFIRLFNKTPKGVVCPNFWLLAWANGCPYHCSYCYLQGTFKGKTNPVVFSNFDKLFKELKIWLEDPNPKILNTGELTDSLALTRTLMVKLIQKFAEQNKHKLLLVTKSDKVEEILGLNHNQQTIVSFSLNPQKIVEKFEADTPSTHQRLEAAWKVKKAGYRLRIRLDPMIPIKNWMELYEDLAKEINNLKPERITLGSLRFYPVVKAYCRDKSVFNFDFEKSVDGRWRLKKDLRLKMYRFMLEKLKIKPVSLCKETVDVVKILGLPQKCNCVL